MTHGPCLWATRDTPWVHLNALEVGGHFRLVEFSIIGWGMTKQNSGYLKKSSSTNSSLLSKHGTSCLENIMSGARGHILIPNPALTLSRLLINICWMWIQHVLRKFFLSQKFEEAQKRTLYLSFCYCSLNSNQQWRSASRSRGDRNMLKSCKHSLENWVIPGLGQGKYTNSKK